MTKVTIFKSNGSYKGFKVEGHAGYAEEGSDVVCAAISVLVITCINSIEAFTNDDFDGYTDENKGIIELNFDNIPGAEAKLLIDSMVLGLREIENDNKEYIKVDFKEV